MYNSHVITLPSGSKVRARRPSLMSLLASGGFPNELTAMVWRLYNKQDQAKQLAESAEGILQLAKLMECYVPHVLVSPRIGGTTDISAGEDGVLQGTLSLIDLTDEDKQYLFLFGQRMVLTNEERQASPEVSAALAEFRAFLASLDAGPASSEVQSEAIKPDSDAEPAVGA